MNDALHAERLVGAKRLRSVFTSNSESIRTAFQNLLPNLRTLIAASPCVATASILARLRERPSNSEKHSLWQRLMIASITHIISSIYLTALLHSFLTLQMNVLARYNLPDDVADGAPPWQLPSGPLASTTSKSFLDLTLLVALNKEHINSVISHIERVVKSKAASIDLASTPSTEELSTLFTEILEKSWNDPTSSEHSEHGREEEEEEIEASINPSLSSLMQSWLYDQVGAHCGDIHPLNKDNNYKFLVGELLDLCEVLDFNQYVLNNAYVARDFVMRRLWNEIDSEEVTKRPTFARLLARFGSLATLLLSHRKQAPSDVDGATVSPSDNGLSSNVRADADDVDYWLAKNDVGMYFAASVFLSGERDTSKANMRSLPMLPML